MTRVKLKRVLGFWDLTLFYLVSGIGVRWISTAAATGESSITVWLLACAGFFLPLAACVFELSSRYPQEGGIYVWTRQAYGEFPAFLAAWTYWMCNLPFFSAVLYFAAGSLLYAGLGHTRFIGSNAYHLAFTVSIIAIVTVLNIVGANLGKWVNNLGAVATVFSIAALIALGTISYLRFGSATHFTIAGLAPQTGVKNLIFLSTIFFAFAGCEAGSFMGEEIRDPRRTVPRALFAGGVLIAFSYIAGTIAMLVALPASSIGGLDGFMSAIDRLCRMMSAGALVAPIALLVVLGSLGGMGAFLSSTSRLPFVVGIDHYLPSAFGRIHPRFKTPYVALLWYGMAGILIGVLGQAGTSVEGAYDLLVSMGVVTTFIPYLFLFGAVIRLQSTPPPAGAMRVPGGRPVAIALAASGLISTAATIVLALFPSEGEAHPRIALLKVLGMTAAVLGAGALVYRRGQKAKRIAELSFQ